MNASVEQVDAISAVIYCRVSHAKQKTQGSGLESQEHRCRQYAELKGYTVEAVFPDDYSGGGDFMKRPGMKALLSYIDAQPEKRFVVIFDDLKRFARDTMFHFELRQAFERRKARVECLNFTFEDTPEGRFCETIFAAQGELEREQNRRQTIQKMKARVEKGYWVFQAPAGYKYAKSAEHGKILVPDEPKASIVCEALEGYAAGRFQTQVEVKRYLEAQPEYPKDLPDGTIRNARVLEMLKRPVYAGYIEAPNWDISLRKGHHEGLISLETFEKIQKRLKEGAKASARKDINEDFPLRGFILCDDCNKPLTACWSTSKTGKKHPYYLCPTKGCASYRKSIKRDQLEAEFEEVLADIQPSEGLCSLVTAMFKDAWEKRHEQASSRLQSARSEIKRIDKKIDDLVDRIVDSENERVAKAYEARIAKMEREKLVLQEMIAKTGKPKHTYEELFELAMGFLASPWKIWTSGDFSMKRIVLRLAFSERVAYSREDGLRTPKKAYPFKALEAFQLGKCEMARPSGQSKG